MTGDPEYAVRFPDIPKLELDQLIDQLLERAQGVQRAQGRLRALLRAVETVSGDLSLDQVLHRIAEAARSLSGAQYAALGVIGEDQRLERFVHVGMSEQDVEAIGRLPEGRGLLGALITDPQPIRLQRIADDPRTVGLPERHPPIDSFLGVPIHVRGRVYGNLYLANSRHGEFSADDEELTIALAVAAGTAISNARLYQEAQIRQQWLEASTEVHAQLLRTTGEDPLHGIARRAFDIAKADLVTVVLVDAERRSFVVECAFGDQADELLSRRFDLEGTLTATVLKSGEPLMVADAASLDTTPLFHRSGLMDTGPVLVVPLAGMSDCRGVLTLARRRNRAAFGDTDLAMAAAFAQQASVALELAEARASEQKMIMLEERERIARDLHDHVIQELFAIGLSLGAVAGQLGHADPLADRVRQQVEDLDQAIRRIRTSIFALRGDTAEFRRGLRQAVVDIAASVTPMLGFPPAVTFAGLLDLDLDQDVVEDAIACVRELVTNVAKHAKATALSIDVALREDLLTIVVTDDGVGLPARRRNSGLDNLKHRATRRGGSFELTPAADGGTVATWTVKTA